MFEFTEGANITIWSSRQNYIYFQLTAISRDTIILPTEYKHCALGTQLGLMRAIKSRANRFKIYPGHPPFIISYPISLCSGSFRLYTGIACQRNASSIPTCGFALENKRIIWVNAFSDWSAIDCFFNHVIMISYVSPYTPLGKHTCVLN